MTQVALFGADAIESGLERLGRITWSLSPMLSKDLKSNALVADPFSQDEAVEITNFIFTNMMGPSAWKRVNNLVDLYNSQSKDGIDRGAGDRARVLAANEGNGLPPEWWRKATTCFN